MRHVFACLSFPLVLLGACATTIAETAPAEPQSFEAAVVAPAEQDPEDAADPEQPDEKSAEDVAREIEDVERKLELARSRAGIAELEARAYEHKRTSQARHTATRVKLAEAELARFMDVDMPNRLADARLDLQGAKDRALEAREELEQIKIMYKDQDLDDLTAEFVVSRGERTAARASARLAIQESRLKALEERELPHKKEDLALAVDQAASELEIHELETEIGKRKQAVSVQEARNAVAELERELADLQEESQP